MGESTTAIPPDIIERQSLCLSRPVPGMVVQQGVNGFKDDLSRHFNTAESNAAEQVVSLKNRLQQADTDAFWLLLTKGLAQILDAQYAFVSKRILVDDKNIAVELPPIGEPGSCLMGEAFYINDDNGNGPGHLRNFKYHAYQCPCAYMKHDKIFVIPERLNDFIVDNPNDLLIPGEAFLGIPLFAEGKCFAHFGVMWGKEGAARRVLSWSFLEMILHSLEDMILSRVLEGNSFAKSAQCVPKKQSIIVPHEAISAAQSLKPYARSLSHELRTPMQGVVGMLDVMMANVKEASETLQIDPRTRQILESLKENIEAVQDSSRRAVEAADNVVHAYDMNMGVPETPLSPLDKTPDQWNTFWREMRPDLMPSSLRSLKRKRNEVSWSDNIKPRISRPVRQRIRESFSEEPPIRGTVSCPPATSAMDIDKLEKTCSHGTALGKCDSSASPIFASEHSKAPGLRHANLREVLQYVINDALKVGGRPDSAIASATDTGEKIEVRTRGSNGTAHTKWIEWKVSPDVPETILIDERDLAKMVSCLALNAIKFTQHGTITLQATLSSKGRYIVINIKDTGSGIPAAFLPNLFKPFSREDDSTTRQSEGLGLGLMVAKGIARKLGGDLFCLRSHVSGPSKGSEFEMRVPLSPGEICSRPATPFGSPTPSIRSRMSAERELSVEPEVPCLDLSYTPVTPPLSSDLSKSEVDSHALGTPAIAIATQTPTPPEEFGIITPRRTSSPPHIFGARALSSERDVVPSDLAKQLPLNILVVDDNAINRRVLVSMLGRMGYKDVQTAFNGNDAVEAVRRNAFTPGSTPYDLVLMDLWMPLLDGFQATEAILGMADLLKKPTIMAVSADITDAALDKAMKSGMKGFMTKPFVTRDIARLIRTFGAST